MFAQYDYKQYTTFPVVVLCIVSVERFEILHHITAAQGIQTKTQRSVMCGRGTMRANIMKIED